MNIYAFGDDISPFFRGTGPDFPACDLESLDDDQCKAIMLRFGVTEFLDAPKPPAGNLPKGSADITAALYKAHPTHWFMFVRFAGSSNPADNGFALQAFLKAKHDHASFVAEVAHFFGQFHRPESGPLTYADRSQEPGSYLPGN